MRRATTVGPVYQCVDHNVKTGSASAAKIEGKGNALRCRTDSTMADPDEGFALLHLLVSFYEDHRPVRRSFDPPSMIDPVAA